MMDLINFIKMNIRSWLMKPWINQTTMSNTIVLLHDGADMGQSTREISGSHMHVGITLLFLMMMTVGLMRNIYSERLVS